MFTSKITMGLGIALALVSLAFGLYFWWSQGKIETLTANEAKLTQAVKEQEETISTMNTKYENQNKQIVILQKRTNEAESRRKELEAMFRSRDLEKEARANRQQVQDWINTDSATISRQLEEVTGAPQSAPTVAAPSTNSSSKVSSDKQPPPSPPKRDTK